MGNAKDRHDWVVVLAGGHGRRMRHLTVTAEGISVPKQYCAVGRGSSLLHAALQRARALAPPERIIVTVAGEHRPWWRGLSAELPTSNILVEPRQRGTGIGILRALLEIMRRDAQAFVTVLPSDHFFANEAVIAAGMIDAARQARRFPREILLLGFDPGDCDPDLGYVVPSEARMGEPRHVRRFVEKPGAELAALLATEGALLNSFIIVGNAQALLQLFERRYPGAVRRLRSFPAVASTPRRRQPSLSFRALPEIDFSRDVMTPNAARLRVLRIAACGWSDLGTQARLERVLQRHSARIAAILPPPFGRRGAVNLAEPCAAPHPVEMPRTNAA
jgi:mannose-1-phosphate guanylyltransferase